MTAVAAWLNLVIGLMITLSMAAAIHVRIKNDLPVGFGWVLLISGIFMSAVGFAGVLTGGVST